MKCPACEAGTTFSTSWILIAVCLLWWHHITCQGDHVQRSTSFESISANVVSSNTDTPKRSAEQNSGFHSLCGCFLLHVRELQGSWLSESAICLEFTTSWLLTALCVCAWLVQGLGLQKDTAEHQSLLQKLLLHCHGTSAEFAAPQYWFKTGMYDGIMLLHHQLVIEPAGSRCSAADITGQLHCAMHYLAYGAFLSLLLFACITNLSTLQGHVSPFAAKQRFKVY